MEDYVFSLANDGFYCQHVDKFLYHSVQWVDGNGWFQADLNNYYLLQCIRIPIRSKNTYPTAHFHELVFRFGNKSRNENYADNPILIAKTYNGLEGKIFEFCLDRHLVGRYLHIEEKRSSDDYITIGEIQILIKE